MTQRELDDPPFFPEEAHQDLLEAGWAKYKGFSAYQAPDGRIFRGPYTAWHVMKGLPIPDPRR